mmetsp:Transcript_28311/g.52699  ORF Transcript_28311/g.52699 Transcript_28311/m.52699 type:complete len:246 (+) Transcript_28311:1970-2707(+)
MDSDDLTLFEVLGKRIRRQRRRLAQRGGAVLVGRPALHILVDRADAEPNVAGHMLASVTSITVHTHLIGSIHVTVPVVIDRLRHLDHAAADNLGIKVIRAVFLQINIPVAIGAPLFGTDPLGHGQHHAVKVVLGQITQHLDILVYVLGQCLAALGHVRLFGIVGLNRWIRGHTGDVELGHRHARAAWTRLQRRGLRRVAKAHDQSGGKYRAARHTDQDRRTKDIGRVVLVPFIKPLGKHISSPSQ